MFGIGLPEVLVIVVVAVFVFGPERLPEFARQAGRMARQLRRLAVSAQNDLRKELGPDYADLKLTDLDPRVALRKHILEAMEDEDDFSGRPPTPTPPATLPQGERPPYDAEAT
jgi:sec-independent protein translocase protein TatB